MTDSARPALDDLWVERTPPGFLFNIKAFGLFTHHPVAVERLPEAVKELLPQSAAEKNRVYLSDVPEEARTLIWEMQVQALAPLAAAGKLGCMLFQFPRWFTARRDNIDYLQQLRERLQWPLAIEFRGGGWMTDNYRAETVPDRPAFRQALRTRWCLTSGIVEIDLRCPRSFQRPFRAMKTGSRND